MFKRDEGRRTVLDPGLIPGHNDRFKRQIEFLLEIDRLKHTFRQTLLLDRSRHENTVEHSWHIAVSAMLFAEHAADDGIDLGRTIRMLLLHDIVEIDAGDTYCYDEQGRGDQHERESRAADRLFGMLPDPQSAEFRSLWDEFETADTAEARYAHAMDRFQAFLHNYATEGQMWREHGIHRSQVVARMQPVERGAPLLWQFVRTLIDDAVGRGYLLP